MAKINKHTFIPIYEQLIEYFRSEINKGKLHPGTKLLPEPTLSVQYGVSRTALRKAFSILTAEGLITQRKGKGTFVSGPNKNHFPTEKRNIIGLMIHSPEFHKHSFLEDLFRGMEYTANKNGNNILLITYNEKSAEFKQNTFCIKLMREKKLDGLIIAGEEINNKQLEVLKTTNYPFVLVSRHTPNQYYSYVYFDYTQAMFLITKHLIKSGHKRIGHIGGLLQKYRSDRNKLAGYNKALKKYNIPYDETILLEGSYYDDETYYRKLTHKLLSLKNHPTAILCADDTIASWVMKTIKEKGLKIPDDIAVAGFNDTPIANLVEPRLTTIHVPQWEAGKIATEILIRNINKKKNNSDHIILKPKLIIRESC